MSWRMDKNKFSLGGRLFNTAPPRLGAPTQCKARPQDGCPNATQDTSASWAPQRNARHVCELSAPMQRKASPQLGHPSARPQRKRKARPHVRKLDAPTKRTSATQTQRMSTRPHVGRPNAMKGASARWAPKRNARRVCKMGAQTKN
jgi:hypothetical protein